MKRFKWVDDRLGMVADLVPPGARLADIGTDHGYLLLELVNMKKISFGIGCDLREGPLSSAEKNVQLSKYMNKIELRLGDGLQPLKTGEVDGATICGMGGGTIRKILKDNEEIWKAMEFVVLQPQGDGHILREYLIKSGWRLDEERLGLSQGKLYEVILALPGDMEMPLDELLLDIGPILWKNKVEHLDFKIEQLLLDNYRILKGLERAQMNPGNAEKHSKIRESLKRLEAFKNEL